MSFSHAFPIRHVVPALRLAKMHARLRRVTLYHCYSARDRTSLQCSPLITRPRVRFNKRVPLYNFKESDFCCVRINYVVSWYFTGFKGVVTYAYSYKAQHARLGYRGEILVVRGTSAGFAVFLRNKSYQKKYKNTTIVVVVRSSVLDSPKREQWSSRSRG